MFKESLSNQSVHTRYYSRRKPLVGAEDVGGKVSFKADCARGYFVEYRGSSSKGLVRYLTSRIGDNWDGVYSDLKRLLRKDALHGLVHYVEDHVMTHTYRAADGTVMARRGMDADVPVASTYHRFYVHPVSRCLQRVEVQSRRTAVRARKAEQSRLVAASRKELPDGSLALNLEGVWYQVELAPVPDIPESCKEYWHFDQRDAVLNRYLRNLSTWELSRVYGVGKMYGFSKKQLSAKAIAKFGLSH